MIVLETIQAAVTAENFYKPGKPAGFAVSTLETPEARLAEVQATWPDLDIDATHVASEEEAKTLGWSW